MIALFNKEVGTFFSTLTGYLVIIVFLLATSLFIWVFPGTMNVLDMGYADLEALFIIAPWVFLFLVPAITMRTFSDEHRSGTIELLITRPVSEIKIILAKFLASLFLVLVSLLPTLIYFLTVYLLGNPAGNIDVGRFWGSFIGLFFLAGIYAAIGIFSSSLTGNQIISFIIAVVLSFVLYIGFDSLSSIPILKFADHIIVRLGINEHYTALSRGVIDSRDIVYYLAVIFIFLFFTKFIIQNRK
jgi:ABC-2 type transport system permease protein